MMVQHPNITAAQGARLGRMVESHLEKLIVASGVPSARDIGTAHERTQLPRGAATSQSETAMAIARGIHQGLSSKK